MSRATSRPRTVTLVRYHQSVATETVDHLGQCGFLALREAKPTFDLEAQYAVLARQVVVRKFP